MYSISLSISLSIYLVPGILAKSLVVPVVKTGNSQVEVPAQVFALCFALCARYARAVLDNFQSVAQQNIRHLRWYGAWATLCRHLRDAPSLLRRVIMVPPKELR